MYAYARILWESDVFKNVDVIEFFFLEILRAPVPFWTVTLVSVF